MISFTRRKDANGQPAKEIPAQEAWLFEDADAPKRVLTGLVDAREGKTRVRGSASCVEGGDKNTRC
jgi:hypothetical protein